MIGSDAVVMGMVGENCYAYSYYLTAKSQCNYQSGQARGRSTRPVCNPWHAVTCLMHALLSTGNSPCAHQSGRTRANQGLMWLALRARNASCVHFLADGGCAAFTCASKLPYREGECEHVWGLL